MNLPNLNLSSPVFENTGTIPVDYTCDGKGVNPALRISGVDAGVKSLVLIVVDPDAPGGTWTHWLVFNLAPDLERIEEGEEPKGTRGLNSWGKTGYGAPCPPAGEHRYFFKLYALDIVLELAENAEREQVEEAMQGHIWQQGELIGKYGK